VKLGGEQRIEHRIDFRISALCRMVRTGRKLGKSHKPSGIAAFPTGQIYLGRFF
jgi:hypothetical protein